MAVTHDLDTPEAIETLVRRFYAGVAADDLLAPVFGAAAVDWDELLARMVAFWCQPLLGEHGYDGDPYRAHQRVHATAPMTADHFVRWLERFYDVVDSSWRGPRAEQAKELARKVADHHCRQIVGTMVPFADPRIEGRGDPGDEGGETACWAHLVVDAGPWAR